jgi:hypothetical protein
MIQEENVIKAFEGALGTAISLELLSEEMARNLAFAFHMLSESEKFPMIFVCMNALIACLRLEKPTHALVLSLVLLRVAEEEINERKKRD